MKSDIISQTASGKSTALSALGTCTPVESQTSFVMRGLKVNLCQYRYAIGGGKQPINLRLY